MGGGARDGRTGGGWGGGPRDGSTGGGGGGGGPPNSRGRGEALAVGGPIKEAQATKDEPSVGAASGSGRPLKRFIPSPSPSPTPKNKTETIGKI